LLKASEIKPIYVKFQQNMLVLFVFIALPKTFPLKNWKLENFNCVFLGTSILEQTWPKCGPWTCFVAWKSKHYKSI